jgi:hypothetical protein
VNRPPIHPRRCSGNTIATALVGGVSVRVVSNGRATRFGQVPIAAVAPNSVPLYQDVLSRITRPITIVSAITEQGSERIAFVNGEVSAPGRSVLYLCAEPLNDPGSLSSKYHWPRPIDFAFIEGTPPPDRGDRE